MSFCFQDKKFFFPRNYLASHLNAPLVVSHVTKNCWCMNWYGGKGCLSRINPAFIGLGHSAPYLSGDGD